ncbi:YolD-like family protein [Bacillus sp. ISL-46]|uniref:YolD-like family protein n=1 Tax=Bacillus sp. ISL-46 TaxID=2819129 RepID=UPI001BE760A1|nr:YolD-like family protein [Bacillus sp. ISL-46]MBT2724775.1 YolD-like family protein [Bacillus sp. ISL-46]
MNKDHKDRGMKKWHGFFMPETIKMLKDLREDDHKTPRPHLDETKIEEMERLLFESMATKRLLEITTWTNGFFTSRVGFVTKIDPLKKKIQIQDELRSTINLDFFSLTNVMVK